METEGAFPDRTQKALPIRRSPRFLVQRKIIHVDMDAFFASVEQRDDPALKGRPVAVGGSSRRGVVAAASYEARAFGVHSAMPSVTAARRCPDLVFVKPRFSVYREVSAQIRAIFLSYTPLVEPLSLDEAYLDVTEPLMGPPSATLIARAIKERIRQETGLTASAGVSFNKFLAKVASAANKPDGLTVIRPEDADAFIDALPVGKFFGVGPVTERRMHEAGLKTGQDLKRAGEDRLVALFGRSGRYYHRAAWATDERPVRPEHVRKSIGAERTFFDDLEHTGDMLERIRAICGVVAGHLESRHIGGYTVTLKIRTHDFRTTTRQTTLPVPVRTVEDLFDTAGRLLMHGPAPPSKPVRLLGVTVSKLRFPDEGELVVQLRLPLDDPGAAPAPAADRF